MWGGGLVLRAACPVSPGAVWWVDRPGMGTADAHLTPQLVGSLFQEAEPQAGRERSKPTLASRFQQSLRDLLARLGRRGLSPPSGPPGVGGGGSLACDHPSFLQEPSLCHPLSQPHPWRGELPFPNLAPARPPQPLPPSSETPVIPDSSSPWLSLPHSSHASLTWSTWRSSCARLASWRS